MNSVGKRRQADAQKPSAAREIRHVEPRGLRPHRGRTFYNRGWAAGEPADSPTPHAGPHGGPTSRRMSVCMQPAAREVRFHRPRHRAASCSTMPMSLRARSA